MVLEPEELRKRRRELGYTQAQLAKSAGVAQGLISKFEARKSFPGYESLKRIEEGLDRCERAHLKCVRDIMAREVYSVRPSDKVRAVISAFKHKKYSQAPVLEGGHVVGLITDNGLLDASPEGTVDKYMEEPPPQVPEDAVVERIKPLLKHYSLVIVTRKGKMVGVVAKADVL